MISLPGCIAGYINFFSSSYRGLKIFRTFSTWIGVRQFASVLSLHFNVSGRNLHKFGSSMMPSMIPSSPSHCFRISLWISVVQVDAVMKSGDVVEPVMGKKLALQETRLLKSRAGDPATIPSKSSGNISEDLIP